MEFKTNLVKQNSLKVEFYLNNNYSLICLDNLILNKLGYSLNELIDKNTDYTELVDFDYKNVYQSLINSDKSGSIFYKLTAKDGSKIPVFEMYKTQTDSSGKYIHSGILELTENTDNSEAPFNLTSNINSRENRETEELYLLAMRQAKISVWEYNIKSKKIKATQRSMEAHGFNSDLENVPEVLILSGHIHPDSISVCENLYAKVNSGKPKVVAEIRKRNGNNTAWWWERITYTSVFDKNGKIIKTIGLGEDITIEKENEIRYKEDIHTQNMLLKNTLCNFQLNLSDNSICFFSAENDFENISKHNGNYEDFILLMEKTIENEEDKKKFIMDFSAKNLKNQFLQGKDHIAVEFRRIDSDGSLKWYKITGHLIKDAIKSNIYAYINIRNIHEQKILEQNLISRAEKDSITGVYNRVTFNDLATKILSSKYKNNQRAAVMVIKLDIYEDIAKAYGYIQADVILKNFADTISMELGSVCIFSKVFSEEFIAFVKDDLYPNQVKELAENLIESMSKSYALSFSKSLPIAIGYCFSTSKKENMENLYSKARIAADAALSNGNNRCVEFVENMDKISDPLYKKNKPENIQKYKDLLIKCAYETEGKTETEDVINTVIQYIKYFYNPDAVAIAEINYNTKNIIRLFSQGISKIDVHNTLYNDMLINYVISKGYILIKDTDNHKFNYPDTYAYIKKNGIKSLIISSGSKSDIVVSCIFIKNPTENIENKEFIDGVSKIIGNKIFDNQIGAYNTFYKYHDNLTKLLNRTSFNEYKSSLKEESLISMGLVSIDINKLGKINLNFGQNYGDNLIIKTANLLTSIFKSAKIYRLFGGYFFVICEDVSQDVFEDCVKKLYNESQNQFNNVLAVGHSWTDTDIKINDLINSCEEKMGIAKENYALTVNDNSDSNEESIADLKKLIDDNRFIVYLQPKLNIKTNTVEAAEALIRYKNDQGTIIYPDRFIPIMEKKGMLKYIDLYVFETVCKLIKSWIDNGINPITVSLNFSRKTILDETLLDEMEEIYNKYKVPRKYLEIEVTESIADVEKETLVKISNIIHNRGYRISIDDFGSKYSNLSILSTINLDTIKIDKSLINNLFSNSKTRLVIHSFIDMCKKMNLECVAEGVETIDQLRILKDMNCDFIQGYYINKPIPIDDFLKLYINKKI